MLPTNLILVGFMGTGKSVVGKKLAAVLGRSFVDTDETIAAEAGRSIREIFASEGEDAFRRRETAALRSLVGTSGAVIATGGGVLLRDENLPLLNLMGSIVCLSARPEVILERTFPWENRPLLAEAADPRGAVEQLQRERAARYGLADVTVETSDRTVDEVVSEICRAFK